MPTSVKIAIVHEVAGGYSDAAVALCDIGSADQNGPPGLDGQFILKVSLASQKDQVAAQRLFLAHLPDFSRDHVPELVFTAQQAGYRIELYDVAGFSLKSTRSADRVGLDDRAEVCSRAADDLLSAQLSAAGQPAYDKSLGEILEAWLGSEFPHNQRAANVENVARSLQWEGQAFEAESEILPNILSLLKSDPRLGAGEVPVFRGAIHGDLHLRNILASGSSHTKDLRYWVIDIDGEELAPLLYDHAYLELSMLLHGLTNSTSGRVLPILSRVDKVSAALDIDIDYTDNATVAVLKSVREAALDVLERVEPKRKDVWKRQFLWARVAAGLDWAAKPLGDANLQRAALLSACWAAKLVLKEYHQDMWLRVATLSRPPAQPARAKPISPSEALAQWAPFRDPHRALDLFLISDGVTPDERLKALAHGRWTNIIDLDPGSDIDGLASQMLADLRRNRHVSMFGDNQRVVSPLQSTNWHMANGWESRNERGPESNSDWRRQRYLHRVRKIIDGTYNGTPNQQAGVICLRSGQRSTHVDQIVEYIDEVYGGISARVDLSEIPSHSSVDLSEFLAAISEALPPAAESTLTMPGLDGPWRIPRVDLNRLMVDLELLHSDIVEEASSSHEAPADEFWRGRPPTWSELEAAIDIPRDSQVALAKDVTERLDSHQLTIVPLDHSPGAGGTTLGRRLAWDLHTRYPAAILRRYSSTTAERIDEIYQETGLSALIVAEASVLPESDREELLQDLRQRNSRAVIVWINRTNVDRGRHHALIDPLAGAELQRFVHAFRVRADSERARIALDDLVSGDFELIPPSKLSPFYLGLSVYDERFDGLGSYVRNHLESLDHQQKRVARNLALITRYGQARGLPIALIRSWLGRNAGAASSPTEDELTALLGPDLRHLVVSEYGSLRLLHPLIAEQVLIGVAGSEQYGLGQIAVDFISDVTAAMGAENESTARLFEELFIRRTSWSTDGRRADNFSELIQAMQVEAAQMVFKELTDRCPGNPHYWNHRGRYHLYRVRGDFSIAETYVQRAVEASNGLDGTHQHTLGMVRRIWIEDRLDELIGGKGSTPAPEVILADIEPLFDLAITAFRDAGRQHENEYNYVTPVQLIATVVEKLWRASGEQSLVDFIALDTPASVWVSENMGVAETFLSNLQDLNADGRFFDALNQRLDILYGDVERLVEEWKRLRELRSESPELDLAIARAIYAGAGRDWSNVTTDDARTIAEMAAGKVRNGQASEADLRLWLQAYRRLPEYTDTYAMERLSWFATERNSLVANYYLSILHFLIWYRGDARDQNRIRFYLEECKRLGRDERRQWSFEWLGTDERSHPLVHFTELGKRRLGPANFWSKPYELARVTGIIEEIRSPQAGLVRVANGTLLAFFTPRNRFLQSRDVNASIEFYLGFSYDGLRAWEPTYPGVEPDATKGLERPVKPRAGKVPEAPAPEFTNPVLDERLPLMEALRSQKPKLYQIDESLIAALRGQGPGDMRALIRSLVDAAAAEDVELSLLALGEALQKILGPQGYNQFRQGSGGKLKRAVQDLGFEIGEGVAGLKVSHAPM